MGSTKTENESNTLSGSVISVDWLSVFICTRLCTVFRQKNSWKCDSQELFERKLVVYFVLIIQGKGSSWKRFDPEIYFDTIAYGNVTRLGFFSSHT